LCADSLEETPRNEDHVYELKKNNIETEVGIINDLQNDDYEILARKVLEDVITNILSNTIQEENKVGREMPTIDKSKIGYSTKNGKFIAEEGGSGKFKKQTSSSSPKSGVGAKISSRILNGEIKKERKTSLTRDEKLEIEAQKEAKLRNLQRRSTEDELRSIHSKVQDKLQSRVGGLEKDLDLARSKLETANENIKFKDETIETYKDETLDLRRKVQILHSQVDTANNKMEHSERSLADLSQQLTESEHRRKSLESHAASGEVRLATLECEIVKAKAAAEEADDKLEEAKRKLAFMEIEMAKLETRSEAAEQKVEKMEEGMKLLEYDLRSAKTTERRVEEEMRGMSELLNKPNDEANKDAMVVAAQEGDKKLGEVSKRVALIEMEKEKFMSDAEAAENKVKSLEERVKELEYELQSARIAEQRAEKAVEHHEERLKIVTGKNFENDARADQAERDVKRLTLELGNAERALQEQVEKLNNFYQDLEKSVNEIMNM